MADKQPTFFIRGIGDSVQLFEHIRVLSGVSILITAVISVALLLLFTLVGELFPFLLIGAGVLLILIIIYAYAASQTLYRKPSVTLSQVFAHLPEANLALAARPEVLYTIAQHGKTPSEMTGQMFALAIMQTPAGRKILRRLSISEQDIENAIASYIESNVTANELLNRAAIIALDHHYQYLELEHIVSSILTHDNLQTWLKEFNLHTEDVLLVCWWMSETEDQIRSKRMWWSKENVLDFTGLGVSWAAGYTPFLDKFLRVPRGNEWDVAIGHEMQVDQLMNSLARSEQANVLLVGRPGVGRFGIVKEMIYRIATNTAHPELRGKRVAYIHLGQIVGMGSSGPEQASLITKVLEEIESAGNIVAVIDGLGSIVSNNSLGINLSDVLTPFLSSSGVRVVVIMSQEEYHQRFENQSELTHLFDVVQVPPLSRDSTLALLLLTVLKRERKSEVFIPYKTLREAVDGTESLLPQIPFPEKAFDILEEAIVEAQGRQETNIIPDYIFGLISRKTGIQQGVIQNDERQKLLQLEDIIHQRVVNQSQAVAALSQAMLRARTNIRNKKRPIGTYLFLGPTGVGKTETAKALARAFFGDEKHLLRIDMSQFQGKEGITQLLGDGRDNNGLLTSLIADHPFSVLLLDEYEKADQAVRQLFLPVFDEGYLTDLAGHTYYFTNTIIITTSNAGAELIRTNVLEDGRMPDKFEETLRNYILEKDIFRPEELNRFDGVITFTPLTKQHVGEIAVLMLKSLNKRLDHEHGVTIAITNELIEYLIQKGYNPEFGARPMARAIQNSVEYIVARQIVQGTTKPGQVITLSKPLLDSIP